MSALSLDQIVGKYEGPVAIWDAAVDIEADTTFLTIKIEQAMGGGPFTILETADGDNVEKRVLVVVNATCLHEIDAVSKRLAFLGRYDPQAFVWGANEGGRQLVAEYSASQQEEDKK